MITIVRKKKGMKSLIKKLVELQHFSSSAGIHTGDGQKKAHTPNRKSKINIATLAEMLEKYASWRQSKTVKIPLETPIVGRDGKEKKFAVIKAGTTLKREARPFISIYMDNTIWSKFRDVVESWVRAFINAKGGQTRSLMRNIGDLASSYQKALALSASQPKNKPITVHEKGFNAPLQRTGMLYKSIKSKLYNGKNGLGVQGKAELKIQDAEYVDKLIAQINRKGR